MIGICNSQVSPLRTWVSRFFLLRHLHLLAATSLDLLCSSFLNSVCPPFLLVILSCPYLLPSSWFLTKCHAKFTQVIWQLISLHSRQSSSARSYVILYLLPIVNVSCLLLSVLAPWYPHTLSFLLSICLTIESEDKCYTFSFLPFYSRTIRKTRFILFHSSNWRIGWNHVSTSENIKDNSGFKHSL